MVVYDGIANLDNQSQSDEQERLISLFDEYDLYFDKREIYEDMARDNPDQLRQLLAQDEEL